MRHGPKRAWTADMNEDRSSMNSAQTEPARPEKALWYQEVLSLDPASRIFLPYARLLAESGRRTEAVDILKAGLLRHPEFLEARLLLIDLLYATGQEKAAALEASSILEPLSRCSSLWKIWSSMPGIRADQAAMLLFFGATFREGGPGLTEVFEAGMNALCGKEEHAPAAQTQEGPVSPETEPADHGAETPAASALTAVASGTAPAPAAEAPGAPRANAAMPAANGAFSDAPADGPSASGTDDASAPRRCFVMDENTPWYSLDSVPEDDDLPDDEDDGAASLTHTPPSVAELFFAGHAPSSAQAEDGEDAGVPAAHPVPRSPLEGKSSLRTRSMAHILEEQGALGEAADIYRELLKVSICEEERAELSARLESLSQRTDSPPPPQPAAPGILDMLETLAVRLENKSRA